MFVIFAYFAKNIFSNMQNINFFVSIPWGIQREDMLGLENIKKNRQFTNDYIVHCLLFCLSIILSAVFLDSTENTLFTGRTYSTGKRSVPIFQSLEQLFPMEDAQISAVPGQLLLR
jgi:hypothetical protein